MSFDVYESFDIKLKQKDDEILSLRHMLKFALTKLNNLGTHPNLLNCVEFNWLNKIREEDKVAAFNKQQHILDELYENERKVISLGGTLTVESINTIMDTQLKLNKIKISSPLNTDLY